MACNRAPLEAGFSMAEGKTGQAPLFDALTTKGTAFTHAESRVIGVLPYRLLSVVLGLSFLRRASAKKGASAWRCCTNAPTPR
jgi:hypothetical protein